MQNEERPTRPYLQNSGKEKISPLWTFVLGACGVITGLVGGLVFFAGTYRPFSGLGNTPIWQVAIRDGFVIVTLGVIAFFFRKKSAFVQGLFVSLCVLFIVNGLCGISR